MHVDQRVPGVAVKISLAMIALVRNDAERAALWRALLSIDGACDEIVVVLDQRSIEIDERSFIAAGLAPTALVRRREFGLFSAQRNFADSLCSGEWTLLLDADDVYATVGDLRELIESAEDDVDAIFGEHRSVDEHGAVIEVSRHPVAYRRGRCSWIWREHSQLAGVRIALDSTAVVRKNYRSSDLPAKARRAIALLERDLADAPGHPHAPFFLARSYWLLNDVENAEKWARRTIELAPRDPGYAGAWVMLAWAGLSLHGIGRATAVVNEGLLSHGAMPDLLHVAAFLAAARWMTAAQDPQGPYRLTTQSSRKHLGALAASARSLGWPIAPAQGGAHA
jgi:tetratricopeptide (TPR) repeat protein